MVNQGYFVMPNTILDDPKLTPYSVYIYAFLVRDEANDSPIPLPSLRSLSRRSHLSVNTIRKCIEQLEERNLIKITRNTFEGTGGKRENIYSLVRLCDELPVSPDDTPPPKDDKSLNDRTRPVSRDDTGKEELCTKSTVVSRVPVSRDDTGRAPFKDDTIFKYIYKTNKENKNKRKNKRFDSFWSAYPNKKSKILAKTRFEKMNVDDVFLSTILSALELQKQEHALCADNGKWHAPWKHPATWLNQGCWDDAVNLKEKNNGQNKHSNISSYIQKLREIENGDNIIDSESTELEI